MSIELWKFGRHNPSWFLNHQEIELDYLEWKMMIISDSNPHYINFGMIVCTRQFQFNKTRRVKIMKVQLKLLNILLSCCDKTIRRKKSAAKNRFNPIQFEQTGKAPTNGIYIAYHFCAFYTHSHVYMLSKHLMVH